MTEPSATLAKKPKWWQRPITWVITIVVGAAGAYATDTILSALKSVAPTDDLVAQAIGTDAFNIVDLHRIHNFSEGRWGYVVPPNADPAPILGESGGRGYQAWAEANNAVDVRYTGWEFTIEGTRASTVEIVNIVPVMEEPCRPPLGGAIFEDQPAGESQKIVLKTDLTKANPVFAQFAYQKDRVPNYFGTKKISLPRGEKNTIVLEAYVAGKHCKFRYRLEYLADGKRSEFLLGAPQGKPFEVTGYLKDPTAYAWVVPVVGCQDVKKPVTGAELSRLPKGCEPHDSRGRL